MTSIGGLGGVLRIHVQILQQARLRKRRFVVDSRASIAMPTSADFEVKGAVYPEISNNLQRNIEVQWTKKRLLVFFCAKDRR